MKNFEARKQLTQTILQSGIFCSLQNKLLIRSLTAKKNLSKNRFVDKCVGRYQYAHDGHQLRSDLERILLSYCDERDVLPDKLLEQEVSSVLSDIEHDVFMVLVDKYAFSKKEAMRHAERLTGTVSLKKIIEKKIKPSVKSKKGTLGFHGLLEPIFNAFQKHLNTNREDTYYYMAYFLTGIGFEKGSIEQVYNRIKKFMSRSRKKYGS